MVELKLCLKLNQKKNILLTVCFTPKKTLIATEARNKMRQFVNHLSLKVKD